MEIRPPREEEFLSWRVRVRMSLGDHVSEEDTRFMRAHRVEMDRLLLCKDGDEIVGSGGADSFDMTLHGGGIVPVAGVAYITTASTHRRRGIQRSIMERIHRDAKDRGDKAAILWASQSLLYSRYGYGNAMPSCNWRILTDCGDYAHAPEWSGRFVRPQRDEAIPLMKEAYERARVNRPGMVTRSDKRWEYEIHPQHSADEFFLIYMEGSEAHAYARYKFNFASDFVGTSNVIESVSSTDVSHAALWRHLLDEDLAKDVKATNRPVDDPLYWMLADPRRLNRTLTDAIWLKLLDPAGMLESRTYPVEGSLVIQVVDSESDEVMKLALDGGVDGARCVPTDLSPDLIMRDTELASAYMGAVSLSMLVSLGIVEESAKSAGAAKRADSMFRSIPAGWNPHHF